MEQFLNTLLESGDFIPVLAITLGILVALVAIVFGSLRRVARVKQLESSRREIAAYVAEGSITPDDAEKLLNAGKSPDEYARCGMGGDRNA